MNVLAFNRVLKESGVNVALSQVIDGCRALELVDIGCKTDFRNTLRSNFICNWDDAQVFDRIFDCFWQAQSLLDASRDSVCNQESLIKVFGDAGLGEWTEGDAEGTAAEAGFHEETNCFPIPTCSHGENLNQKDFSKMGTEEVHAISQAILLIAPKIATLMARRKKRRLRGDRIDLRWTWRKNIKYGGDCITLIRRKRRINKTRIVLLCDVSGSMDCYSQFFIQFMYALQREIGGVETFVFSTSLNRITHLLRSEHISSALERISRSAMGWSGGTNIGGSLGSFNREFAANLVDNRTIIVIVSDGWERGDPAVLGREMKSLRKRCCKIIWLNPLLASKDYEPLCQGIQAVLPHLDFFLPAHNLDSLVALGKLLPRLMYWRIARNEQDVSSSQRAFGGR